MAYIDLNGDFLWDKRISMRFPNGDLMGMSIVGYEDGSVTILGNRTDSRHLFWWLRHVDQNETEQWAKNIKPVAGQPKIYVRDMTISLIDGSIYVVQLTLRGGRRRIHRRFFDRLFEWWNQRLWERTSP